MKLRQRFRKYRGGGIAVEMQMRIEGAAIAACHDTILYHLNIEIRQESLNTKQPEKTLRTFKRLPPYQGENKTNLSSTSYW